MNQLDRESPGWRGNTVILLDNAKYHTCPASLEIFKRLRIDVCFTGTYSYDAAVCELFFAAYKSADINPRHVLTGKK